MVVLLDVEQALSVIKFFEDFRDHDVSAFHLVIASVITCLLFLGVFLYRKFWKRMDIVFSPVEFLVKFAVAFAVEFLLIWIYSPNVWALSVALGAVFAVYCRNRFFRFLDAEEQVDKDLDMRMELNELKTKFRRNPHYSILEVLLYYGYISAVQKEMVETRNIFKTPDEMAQEMLTMPVLTEAQLKEAKGIMNVIRRENKVLTREEALLLIMQAVNSAGEGGDDGEER